MAARKKNGQFAKGHKAARRSTALVLAPRSYPVPYASPRPATRIVYRAQPKRHHKRRRSHGGASGGVKLMPLALTALGLAYVATKGPQSVLDVADKIPGAAKVGRVAAIGGVALAAHLVLKPKGKLGKIVKYAAIVGAVALAIKVGTDGIDGLSGDDFDGSIEP